MDGSTWGDWTTLATAAPEKSGSDWSLVAVDLTDYAEQRIRIAFLHSAYDEPAVSGDESYGWYIDEVEIWKGDPTWTGSENFENGWGNWHTDQGVWGIGVPSAGPASAREGTSVAGTILDGNYPANTDSRLISPPVVLPSATGSERMELRFYQWYSYSYTDSGKVQVSIWDGSTWGDWTTLVTAAPEKSDSDWSLVAVDLTDYAEQRIRIAFLHSAYDEPAVSGDESYGWYIDRVEIWKGDPSWTGSENFENGWGNWHTDQGVWGIGVPSAGPASAREGTSVAGTILDGNYPANTDSRLISPPIVLPSVTGSERMELRFYQWYSYSYTDSGKVQVSIWDGSTWGDWTTLVTAAPTKSDSDWSLVAVDLTDYAEQRIRIAFLHSAYDEPAVSGDESYGWYIDQIEIWKAKPNSIEIISLSDTRQKYCSPVIGGPVNSIKIDLETPQDVHVVWYLDDAVQLEYNLTVVTQPFFDDTFLLALYSTVLERFNEIGSHTIEVLLENMAGNILAVVAREYDIVPCSGAYLSFGSPSSQCQGVIPESIQARFSGDGSGFATGYWSDDSGRWIGANIPEGDFNAVDYIPATMLSLFDEPGDHYLRLDLQMGSSGDTYVSDTILFHIQPCEKPIIITKAVSNITSTSASGGGNVTDNGGAPVTARGICWSSTENPTTANNKTSNGSGEGDFTCSIISLTGGQRYHMRAYAANCKGTAYGSDVSFTTPYGETLYVSSDGDCGSNTPCHSTVQSALNAAGNGVLIKVEQGIYKEAPTKSTAGAVTINGGWNVDFTGQTGISTMYVPHATGNAVLKLEPNIKVAAPN